MIQFHTHMQLLKIYCADTANHLVLNHMALTSFDIGCQLPEPTPKG